MITWSNGKKSMELRLMLNKKLEKKLQDKSIKILIKHKIYMELKENYLQNRNINKKWL